MQTTPASAQTFTYSGSETSITLNPGTYDIAAYGAQGGGFGGNQGAEVAAQFSFQSPLTLTILVGGAGGAAQQGGEDAGGGGGGSFVVNAGTPLLVAGGGGGSSGYAGSPGVIGTSGSQGAGITVGANGGTAGSGGGAGNGGAGGGGFYGSGVSTYSNPYNLYGGIGGASFLSGGAGGSGRAGNGSGGFGGGGSGGLAGLSAPAATGGGGGGYSGGGGGGYFVGVVGGGGGGGGSYIASAGQVISEAAGVQSGNGLVQIQRIYTPVVSVSSNAPSAFGGQVGSLNLTGGNGGYTTATASFSPTSTGYFSVSTWNPTTDTEIYALNIADSVGDNLTNDLPSLASQINGTTYSGYSVIASTIDPTGVLAAGGYDFFIQVNNPTFGTGTDYFGFDLSQFSANGDVLTASSIAVVPEPASFGAVAIASLALLSRRRRRR
jgi:hypothetical protein